MLSAFTMFVWIPAIVSTPTARLRNVARQKLALTPSSQPFMCVFIRNPLRS
jgi:hypothetical protein